MNIIRWLGRKRVLTSLLLMALSAVGIQFALTPQRIVVHPDIRWSPTIKKALKKAIASKALRTIGASGLRALLSEEYPCLKDIAIRYTSSLEATVKLSGWNPRVVICSSLPGNKVYVVCEKGIVLEKNFFTVEALQGLPTLVIEGTDFEEKRQSPEFVSVALKVSGDLLDQYDITWYSKTTITLKDKHNPILITADSASVHDEERYAYVQRIFATERQYSKGMKSDIRLKDSLVCAPARSI